MSLPTSRQLHTREILERLESGDAVSQRSLSRDLGIALGLTNLLLRQMARKGWVQLRRLKANRVRYRITPSGAAEKARLSRDYLRESVRFYGEARNRMRALFAPLTAEATATTAPLRVVFWGAGEVAEVAFICLQDSHLVLVGVIDDGRVGGRFFGHEVRGSHMIDGPALAGEPFDRVIVLTATDASSVCQQLVAAGIHPDHVLSV